MEENVSLLVSIAVTVPGKVVLGVRVMVVLLEASDTVDEGVGKLALGLPVREDDLSLRE